MKKLLLAGLLCCAHAFAQNMPSTLSQSTLTANVLATGGGPVSISAPFPFIPSAPLNQGVIYMDSEAMLVLSANLSLNQLTVLRGYLATTAAAHNAGALAFSGQPFQFISVDKSGACDPNSPQFLNVSDQTYFTCTTGAWVGAATSNGGGGAGNPGGTNGQIQFNNAGVFGGITATGTGNVVKATSPTLVTPALGTPSALVLTNATALPGGQISGANSVPASTLPLATTGAFGAVKPDGTTITISAGVISSTGGGGGVTWPTTGDLILSNSTSSPAGLAPINGDCVIGSGSAWVAGSCAGGSFTLPNGILASRPTAPASPTLYLATDQPGLQELNTWDGTAWNQLINIDSSGLKITSGTLGVDQTIIPCLTCANVLTALNKLGGVAGTGSAPAISNGTGTMSVNSGSTNVAGSLTSSTSGTVAFTLTWASLTYAHRAVCHFVDETTAADSVKTTQGTVPTTTTLTATGTTVSGDIVSYSCAGY